MKRKDLGIIWCFLVLFSACSPARHSSKTTTSGILESYGPSWATLWQQRSAEYKALCFQAYNIAKERLDASLSASVQNPAVVTDIDETILDNSPYNAHQSLKGDLYSDSSWRVWTAKIAADTVPGALTFLKYAASRGVQIFYISNRVEAERSATIANLKKWNFPDADDNHLLLKATTSNKDEKRKLVADQHNVLLLLGDNLGDFSGIFDHKTYEKRNELAEDSSAMFGKRFIVLPNPMYGEWLGALLNYQYQQTKEQRNAALLKWLRTY